jgi:hypothetical protein
MPSGKNQIIQVLDHQMNPVASGRAKNPSDFAYMEMNWLRSEQGA